MGDHRPTVRLPPHSMDIMHNFRAVAADFVLFFFINKTNTVQSVMEPLLMELLHQIFCADF